jgi:hypothetical protein
MIVFKNPSQEEKTIRELREMVGAKRVARRDG